MRAFIAIDVSDEIKEAIAKVEAHLRYAAADVKWVRPETVHLTIKFLGEINEEKAKEAGRILDKIAGKVRPFELGIKDVGAFPGVTSPRVIWVGLGKGAAESTALAGEVDEALSKIGYEKESRPFSPHLTIGRVKSPKNKEKLKEKIVSAVGLNLPATKSCEASSVILYQSTLTPQGSIYTKLHEAAFKA